MHQQIAALSIFLLIHHASGDERVRFIKNLIMIQDVLLLRYVSQDGALSSARLLRCYHRISPGLDVDFTGTSLSPARSTSSPSFLHRQVGTVRFYCCKICADSFAFCVKI